MTRLTKGVRRVIDVHGLDVVVRAEIEGLYFRESGRRTEYGPLAWGALYRQAAAARAEEIVGERAARRRRPR